MLLREQIDKYNELGYLVLKSHIPLEIIEKLRKEILRIEQEAIGLLKSNEFLDLEDSHTPDNPRIRRIKLPHTQSNFIKDLMYSKYILDPVKDLIGPNLRLHTSK